MLSAIINEDMSTLAIVAGSVILIVAMNCISSVIKAMSRERTRREIAAFVAEGSMTPEQGERLLRVGKES